MAGSDNRQAGVGEDVTLEGRIREVAAKLGFCKAGFTTMDDLPRVVDEASRRGYVDFFQNMIERGSHPRELYPEGKSIIVLAYDYSEIAYPDKLLPHVSRTYLSRSYLPLPGSPARDRLDAFERFLASEGVRFEPDRNILMMRPTALRAGVISFGRNNFAYVDGAGSFVILYGYLVDVELQPDEPSPDCTCPPGCRACVRACPTGALSAPFELDLGKCILYDNAIRPRRGDGPDVPPEHREAIGLRVHGCDACQEACPRNRRALENGHVHDPVLERIAEGFSLEKLLHMPDGFYEDSVRPIMYNYISDPAIHQRNAAVAMGNSGDMRYIPHLRAELDNPDAAVRSHVRWALDKLTKVPGTFVSLQAFFEQVDGAGVTNAEKVRANQQVLRRVAETDKSRSVDAVDRAGSDVENGIVIRDGKLVGFGIDIFNEDVYPLRSFEIYLRSCDLVGSLDLTGCSDLVFVDLYHNQIEQIVVQGLDSMRIFGVQDNRLRELAAREMPACQGIDAGKNQLAEIDVSGNPELVELYVNDNDLASLDVSANAKLKYLYCHNNRIGELDTTGNPLLRHLNATGNPLKRVRCLAPQCEERRELELVAGEGGSVGLEFGPVYDAQWKETGVWKQRYIAYPEPGYGFEAWVEDGRAVSHDASLSDEYGASRRLTALFRAKDDSPLG